MSTVGTFRLQSRQPFLNHALAGEDIDLEEVGDGILNMSITVLCSVRSMSAPHALPESGPANNV